MRPVRQSSLPSRPAAQPRGNGHRAACVFMVVMGIVEFGRAMMVDNWSRTGLDTEPGSPPSMARPIQTCRRA